MIELLSPAGSPEAVIAAVQNGADAVYMGMGNFNARRGAKNFTDEEFERAVRYCHVRGCKVYVTLNTLINDREVEPALQAARLASEVGTDGIIIQDLGLIAAVRQYLPDIPLHASTQMSIHNLPGVEAAAELGMTRAVLARELSLDQIRYITQNSPIETEIFVHGALCFCHSGQCYMSALIGQRSGNRGMCAQPCRLQYSLGGRMDDHPLSLKDNCLIDRLQEIEDAGVACIKIEGRMKRPEYTAIVTRIYANALKEDLAALARERLPGLRPVVCANLPYNITSPALTAIIEAGCFETVTVMIQREVARRICAGPGSADYGAFGIFVQWHMETELLFDVPPSCFVPQPQVTRSVIRLTRREQPPVAVSGEEAEEMMFRLVRAAFNQRRKTLVNAAASQIPGLDKERTERALTALGYDTRVRGEVLGVSDFVRLAEELRGTQNPDF